MIHWTRWRFWPEGSCTGSGNYQRLMKRVFMNSISDYATRSCCRLVIFAFSQNSLLTDCLVEKHQPGLLHPVWITVSIYPHRPSFCGLTEVSCEFVRDFVIVFRRIPWKSNHLTSNIPSNLKKYSTWNSRQHTFVEDPDGISNLDKSTCINEGIC